MPSALFSEDRARRYLSMIRAGNLPVTQGKTFFADATTVSLIFDFNKQQASKALGGLFSFLHKYPNVGADINISIGLIDLDSFIHIDLFASFSISISCSHPFLRSPAMVTMDPTAFRALQIFQTEQHPSMHGIGIPREGFSLFTLLSNTASQVGSRMLRYVHIVYVFYLLY